MNMSEVFLKNHVVKGKVKSKTEILTETFSIKYPQNLFCEMLFSFAQIISFIVFWLKIIPIDARTLNQIFIPRAAFGLGKIIAIIATPSEFSESDFRKKIVPRL